MTKNAKFRKIRFKPFSKDGNYNPWFDTVQSFSGAIFTQCIQQFSSSETSRPIQNAYTVSRASARLVPKNRTCWVFVFWSFQSRKAQLVLVSLYLKQLYFSFLLSEETNSDAEAFVLVFLYLYAASTFGYTNSWAAEIVKQLGDRKQVLVMRLLHQFKRRHLTAKQRFMFIQEKNWNFWTVSQSRGTIFWTDGVTMKLVISTFSLLLASTKKQICKRSCKRNKNMKIILTIYLCLSVACFRLVLTIFWNICYCRNPTSYRCWKLHY
jgi:hypothetical protein